MVEGIQGKRPQGEKETETAALADLEAALEMEAG